MMPNREGTIKRLQDSLKVMNKWCRTDSLDDPISCIEHAIEEAIMLLQEQDTVDPIYAGNDEWLCPECGTVVGWQELDCGGITETRYKYCPECGKVVKWNGN